MDILRHSERSDSRVRREFLDYRLGGEKKERTYIEGKRLENLCDRPIPEADEEKVKLLNSFALLFQYFVLNSFAVSF